MKKKLLVWTLAILVLAGAGFGGYQAYLSSTRVPPMTFKTVKAAPGHIMARVTATGTLSAHVTVQVGSQVSGRLQQILVDFNSQVKKGDVIAKIDPAIFEANVAQARANLVSSSGNLAKAKATAADAERKLARAKDLVGQGLLSTADLETAQTAAEAARAGVAASGGDIEQARASLHQAQVNLNYTTIVSPIDGVVISRNVDVGQTVAASLSAPVLFTIAEDLRKMQVDTNIAESDVGKLVPGTTSSFVVDAYPNKRFKGTIRQIRNAPQTVQNVVTYDAVIDVDNEQLELKPGMTANVTVIYADKDGVLAVPNAALRFRPPAKLLADTATDGGAGSGSGSSSGGGKRDKSDKGDGSTSSHRGRHGAPASSDSASAPPPSLDGGAPAHGAHDGGAPPSGSAAPAGSAAAPWGGAGNAGSADTPDKRTLWVLRGAQPERVRVRVGISDGTLTEILDGDLHDGDDVVTEAVGGEEAAPAGSAKPGAGSSGSMPRMRL